MFGAFARAGLAVSGIDVGESYGSPEGRALFGALHAELTEQRGMSATPALLARSRGGLMLYNWAAENPSRVSCIAGIYPVCNLESYPGLETACAAYGMTAAELSSRLEEHNPLERLGDLASSGVPIHHIHGDADTVVPLEENSGALAERYRGLGGKMTLDLVRSRGHDHWSGWFESSRLVEFVVARAR